MKNSIFTILLLVLSSLHIHAADGNSCTEAVTVGVGTHTTPGAPYWYAFTVTEANKNLVISSVGHTDEDTYLSVYSGCGGFLLAGNDDFSGSQSQVAIYGLEANDTVYIYWEDVFSNSTFNWSLSLEEVGKGDICELADTASEGKNTMPSLDTVDEYWYTFTMPVDDSKLVINHETAAYVNVFRNNCTNPEIIGWGFNKLILTDISGGETVYIMWTVFNGGGFDWQLEIDELAPGDQCDDPLILEEGTHTAPYAPYWYAYVVPEAGKELVVSSVGLTNEDTYLYVYDGCSGELLASNDDFDNDYQSEVSLPGLEVNDTVYIYWGNDWSTNDFTWELSLEAITGISVSGNIIETGMLEQNYPNPFTNSTSIHYRLAEYSEVNITIYNIQGQPLYTLVNGEQQAGEYTVQWDGINYSNQPLAGGVYFCRMTVKSQGQNHVGMKTVIKR